MELTTDQILELFIAWCEMEAAELLVVEKPAMCPTVFASNEARGLKRAAAKARELRTGAES